MEGRGAGDGRGGGGGAVELRRWMAAQRVSCERKIAVGRERAAAASSAFNAALLSARSLACHTLSHREKLNGLKDQLRELEADLVEAFSIQVRKESKYKLTGDSISNTTATNGQLRDLVTDQRGRKDEYVMVISNMLEAIEVLEAKSDKDVAGSMNLEEAITWYDKFLGFQVVGGEGVKFIFNKIDLQSPEKEYLFCIKLDKDKYTLLQCDPFLKDSEELMKDLNCTNDLFKFVRIMRERFQAATVNGVLPASAPDTSSVTVLSLPAILVGTRSESTSDQCNYQSGTKSQAVPNKRGSLSWSAKSPGTMKSSTRRSPRLAGIR